MNILFLAPHPFFQNRGTPIAVRLMLETLSELGHQIVLLTFSEGEDVDIDNCVVLRLPKVFGIGGIKPGISWKKIVYDLFMIVQSRQLMFRYQFDLIHAVEESAFIAAYLKKSFNLPFVYDMDSSLSQQVVEKYKQFMTLLPIFNRLEAVVVKSSLGVIPVCKSLEDKVIEYAPGKLIQRLEDISFLPDESSKKVDKENELNLNSPVVMYVGNLEKYQGIDLLIDAFQIVNKEFSDIYLVIIGGEKKDIQHYKEMANNLNLSSKTLFLGPKPLSDLQDYLKQADILVSPRISGQNTPMKIYSYLDSGKPLLATDLPTHNQVLDTSIACLRAPNAGAMADGMLSLLKNPDKGRTLAKRAKTRVQKEFTRDAFRKKVNDFYQQIEQRIGLGQV